MRVFLIGSKELSCNILEELLIQGHQVLGVYSRDNEAGMKIWHKLGHRSLTDLAKENNIPSYQKMKVNSPESLKLLSSLNLDIILSCFWSEIFKEPILNIPKLGVYNFHTAFLPKNRGSRPIPWALIKGENQCGITVHKMLTGIDNGPIVAQKSVDITDSDTAKTLYNKVLIQGASLAKEVIKAFAENSFTLTLQDEEQVTYQPRGEPYGGQINPYWSEAKQKRFKAAFTFPPFRSWKPYPNQKNIKLYIIISNIGVEAELLPDTALKTYKKSSTSIGEQIWRDLIKNSISNINQQKLIIEPEARDQSNNYPLLDILISLNYSAVSFTSVSDFSFENRLKNQPFRYKNGILEIPHFKVKRKEDISKAIKMLYSWSENQNHPVFLHLLIYQIAGVDDYISKEIKNMRAEKITFQQVCDLFNTEYEKISS